MDTVIFDKKEYTKASVAAKQFRYTSDYVGQLCRSKKVDSRLVGRTWFVSVDSLVEYRSNKHAKTKLKAVKKKPAPLDEDVRKVPVSPVFTNKAAKSMVTSPMGSAAKTRDLKVSYEVDDGHLIPNITRKVIRPPKTVRVELADSKKLNISGNKGSYSFSTEVQPEATLSGSIKIESLPESEPEPEIETDTKNNIENITISDEYEVSKKLRIVDKKEVTAEKIEVVADEGGTEVAVQQKKSHAPQAASRNRVSKPKAVVSFANNSPERIQPVRISTPVLLSPLIATVLALICVSVIFSASANVTVTDTSYESNVLIQVANLLEFFN